MAGDDDLAVGEAVVLVRGQVVDEDRTAALRVWTPGIVDGLVQAQAYAAALIATSPGVSDDAAAARLNARMERQRRVLGRDKPPGVTLLVDEAALYRQVGTAEVMAAQLCRLRKVAALPAVLMQVMPEVPTPRWRPVT